MKAGFISRRKSEFECSECGTYLQADKKHLSSIGGLGGGIGGAFGFAGMYLIKDGSSYWFLPFLGAIAVLFIFAKIQNSGLELSVGEKPETKSDEEVEIEKREALVRFLMKKYEQKSIEELQAMKSNSELAEAARTAANKILDERLPNNT